MSDSAPSPENYRTVPCGMAWVLGSGNLQIPGIKNSELEFWKNGPVFPELEF